MAERSAPPNPLPQSSSDGGTRWRLFRPILSGARFGDRAIACLGIAAAIAVTAAVTGMVVGWDWTTPILVAPIGAASILVFILPSSPLAQPWPVIGGNTLSTIVGVAVAQWVSEPVLAAGIAVPLALIVMSLARCLHPPGGSAALLGVLGGPDVTDAGFLFALNPVALNTALLVLIGIAFHRALGGVYPQRPALPARSPHGTADRPAAERVRISGEDVDQALADIGETFDIGRDDLERIVRRAERNALRRTRGGLRAADIMSRDMVKVAPDATPDFARALIISHALRTLPVINAGGRLLGVVGLRDLSKSGATVAEVMSPALTVSPETPAIDLADPLTGGASHAAIVLDGGTVVGIITQTDLLAALAWRRS